MAQLAVNKCSSSRMSRSTPNKIIILPPGRFFIIIFCRKKVIAGHSSGNQSTYLLCGHCRYKKKMLWITPQRQCLILLLTFLCSGFLFLFHITGNIWSGHREKLVTDGTRKKAGHGQNSSENRGTKVHTRSSAVVYRRERKKELGEKRQNGGK